MSAKAVIEIRDVIRVWIELRAPKKGELTWSVPSNATPEEALEHVLVGRDAWSAGEAGFGYRAFRDVTPEFEIECEEQYRNIVVHVDYVRTEPKLSNVKEGLKRLIVPTGVTVTVNGEVLPPRVPLKSVEATLATEVADEEGVLRRSTRKTTVHVYEALPGQPAMLHELGVPVVETGDKFDVSVDQKCPLNMDRDNVTPGYLRDVRTIVVNAMHDRLTSEDANATFVNEALADEQASPEAVKTALDLKFSEKRAIRDPRDPEANMNLVEQGYTLINSNQLTREQWDNVKKHDPQGTRPAGQIAPTKKALFGPGGKDTWVPREKWTPSMRAVVAYAADVCRELLDPDAPVSILFDGNVRVSILADVTEGWIACFGSQGLVFNLGRLGHAFFDACATGPTDQLNELLIHELGHGMPGGENHLAAAYHEGLCKLGAKLARLALTRPRMFAWKASP